MAQLVSVPPCHGGGCGFESRLDRHLCRCSSMVEHDLAMVDTGVRFPSSAPLEYALARNREFFYSFSFPFTQKKAVLVWMISFRNDPDPEDRLYFQLGSGEEMRQIYFCKTDFCQAKFPFLRFYAGSGAAFGFTIGTRYDFRSVFAGRLSAPPFPRRSFPAPWHRDLPSFPDGRLRLCHRRPIRLTARKASVRL